MNLQSWTRLTRDQAHVVLQQLGENRDSVVFSKEATDVSWRNLPFYTNYRLYRLINYATMPTFSMTYISNGEEYIGLDGTANPIYVANDRDPIQLTEANVTPYLDFFFSNVQGTEGDVFIIKDPRKMPFLDSLSLHQQQSVINSFRGIKVSFDPDTKSFKVTGTLYYGGALIAATIVISPSGRLSFEDQNLLLTGIHFPPTPYGHAWLEDSGT